mmetsp:Transcript_14644/g.30056  ORF Transcript_14644/g.30056 Transcript_14644/m.30056 type:complete len:309 (+) Transcript_14644:573-1499(+)
MQLIKLRLEGLIVLLHLILYRLSVLLALNDLLDHLLNFVLHLAHRAPHLPLGVLAALLESLVPRVVNGLDTRLNMFRDVFLRSSHLLLHGRYLRHGNAEFLALFRDPPPQILVVSEELLPLGVSTTEFTFHTLNLNFQPLLCLAHLLSDALDLHRQREDAAPGLVIIILQTQNEFFQLYLFVLENLERRERLFQPNLCGLAIHHRGVLCNLSSLPRSTFLGQRSLKKGNLPHELLFPMLNRFPTKPFPLRCGVCRAHRKLRGSSIRISCTSHHIKFSVEFRNFTLDFLVFSQKPFRRSLLRQKLLLSA